MPELPDVETYKRYLDATARGKQVRQVHVADSQVLVDSNERQLNRELKRRKIGETRRRGKYLLVKVGAQRWLAVHFGMTGDLAYYKDNSDGPDHAQVVFDLSNDYHLAYAAPRKLGNIRLVPDLDDFIEQQQLGPDALDEVDAERFAKLLNYRRGAIKSALMDQSLLAGIGNVYSDEILYRARLHPATKVKALTENDLKKLWGTVSSVLEKAIEKKAQPQDLPDSWLLRRREDGARCGICDGKIVKRKFSGRGAYLCEKHQKEKT